MSCRRSPAAPTAHRSARSSAKSSPSGLRNAPGAVEAAEAGDAVDPDDRPGVRRVDEPAAADVDPDVAEAVEEDEVAGRWRGDRLRRVPLGDGVVRERDPELGVDVHHEAGAVEAARARAAVDVRDAEIAKGDRGGCGMAGATRPPGRHAHRRRRGKRGGGGPPPRPRPPGPRARTPRPARSRGAGGQAWGRTTTASAAPPRPALPPGGLRSRLPGVPAPRPCPPARAPPPAPGAGRWWCGSRGATASAGRAL